MRKGWDSGASFLSNTLRLLLVPWWEWEGRRKVSKTQRGEESIPNQWFCFICILYYELRFTEVFGLTDRFVYLQFLILKTL